ncbi:AAA family ATPase [Paraburkholderia megapolitana]|uniref:RecBCD enzyme subunit RecD n=1 Tax=Paraburkholderia megapolitana TaxID=420953 RepID=A0A1I3R3E2_9BURK|nr:AAA family ATPase [Paraburkholderia megapolitana]QDQ83686.1 AAA family ATPase [Paraburkholderia megapolitana]SFJ41103.1 exodeoxyribonuclease V alpha subunit [Paraburkholderia megapolitana]
MSASDTSFPMADFTLPTPVDFSTALADGFARRIATLTRRLGATPASMRWAARAAFAASRATAEGHVCVPLSTLAHRYAAPLDLIHAALFDSGVVSDGSQDASALRPLVVDAEGRLYLARYYDYERSLARLLVAHARAARSAGIAGIDPALPSASPDAHALHARLSRYFGPVLEEGVDWQRVAVATALSSGLTIVSGGPGTGKTTTVVGVLACLLDMHADLRIALAAPTGKAAQRMQEALLARAGSLPPELAARLPQTSYTLHRLLGAGPGGRFRHHRDNPLPYDVVVVDEASMIDVAMAAHLLDAIAPHTRLVMLGDKDQLAAVEAGAVFAELSARPSFSALGLDAIAAALAIDVATLTAALPRADDRHQTEASSEDGWDALPPPDADIPMWLGDEAEPWWPAEHEDLDTVPLPTDDLTYSTTGSESLYTQKPVDAAHDPLADCVVWLERNYRFGLESAIGRLSLAIRRGATQAAFDVLTADTSPQSDRAAVLHEDAEPGLSERTVTRLATGFAPYSAALRNALAEATPDPLPLFDALNRFRILCATRSGPRGVEQLNAAMAAQVRRSAHVPLAVGAQWFAGRPVMVARNDYALGLFNGDIGVTLPGPGGALRVYFRSGDGSVRAVSPAALPPHDTAFALTVHKSQGSEFEHAVLVLPSAFSRVLSRELVYTAITRARERVEVIGSRAVLAQAIATPTRRDSGLAARIAATVDEAGSTQANR